MGFSTSNTFKDIKPVTYTSAQYMAKDEYDFSLEKCAYKALLQKTTDWSYEHEYRYIEKNEKPYISFLAEELKEVIFGAFCSELRRVRIINLIHRSKEMVNVKFFQAIRDSYTYNLDIIPLQDYQRRMSTLYTT